MKNITFAKYKDKKYSAGIKSNGKIVLRSNNIEDLNNGFVEKTFGKNHIYIKYVSKYEVQEIYDKRVVAAYKGYSFEVIDETDDMISIVTMTGDYQEWLRLGMKCIDKGVYQKWISRDEAKIIIKKESSL